MFAKPRPKKSILPPPVKKRKTTSDIEEIAFNDDARHEYLTGFHKRKQQRIKNAQEEAAKKARLERIETRKQLREERRREVEEHVQTVNNMLREAGVAGTEEINKGSEGEDSEEWDGLPDVPDNDLVDHEEEYIDEDRYTTVTVESVTVSREGLEKPAAPDDEEENEGVTELKDAQPSTSRDAPKPKKSKKKFRYETKYERQITGKKERARNKSKR